MPPAWARGGASLWGRLPLPRTCILMRTCWKIPTREALVLRGPDWGSWSWSCPEEPDRTPDSTGSRVGRAGQGWPGAPRAGPSSRGRWGAAGRSVKLRRRGIEQRVDAGREGAGEKDRPGVGLLAGPGAEPAALAGAGVCFLWRVWRRKRRFPLRAPLVSGRAASVAEASRSAHVQITTGLVSPRGTRRPRFPVCREQKVTRIISSR